MTFAEELKSAKDNQSKIDEITKQAMAELVSLRASQNKAILTLSEVDMSEMFNVGRQNVANLSAANGQHSWAQFYLDYSNRRKESDREEEKKLLAAVNKLYNPNAGNNGESEKSTIGQIADILSEGVKDALTSIAGDLKGMFSIEPAAGNASGAPYGVTSSSSGFGLESIQNRASIIKNALSGSLGNVVIDGQTYNDTKLAGSAPFMVMLRSNMEGNYNTGVESFPNDRWPYRSNDANSNMLISTTNGSGVGLGAWTPINSSVLENTRTVATARGQVTKAQEFFNSFTGKNVKYSYGFSFDMRFKIYPMNLPGTVERSFFYSEEDANIFNKGQSAKNGDTHIPATSSAAGVNWVQHNEVWNLNADTGYKDNKGQNDVAHVFKANINKKLFNSYLDEDDDFFQPDYYKTSTWALTQTSSSGLWANATDLYKSDNSIKPMKVGSEVKDIKTEQETLTNSMLSKPSVTHKHSDATADVVGGSYSYTTPNQKANVNYLISHEASDFMNNMFTCWIESDGEENGGDLYNFNNTIENTYTSSSLDEINNIDKVKGALQFTFGVKKINVPLPMQGNQTSSLCGIPYVIAGGKAPTVKRRASIEVASDQMHLIYGTIYNWISMYKIHKLGTISPSSFFKTNPSLKASTTDSLDNIKKINLCVLAWTDNRVIDAVIRRGAQPNIKQFDNFSELIDSGYVKNSVPIIPMNLIVFKNVRFEKIGELAYKNSGHSPLSHKIDFAYQEAYIREWAISVERERA